MEETQGINQEVMDPETWDLSEDASKTDQTVEAPKESAEETVVEEAAAEAIEAAAEESIETTEEVAEAVAEESVTEEAAKENALDASDEVDKEEEEQTAEEQAASESNLVEKIGDLEKAVGSLNNLMLDISGSSERTASQLNQVNERLHKENLKLKEGLYDSLILPVLKDIIALANNIGLDVNRYRKNDGEQIAEALESILEDIHNLLEEHNVEAYKPNEGEKCEPLIHKVLKTVDTDEKEKDRTIAQVQSFGYRYRKGDTQMVLLPCKVYAYQYKENGGIEK